MTDATEITMENIDSSVPTGANPLLTSGNRLEQFQWVSEWLSKYQLLDTLDKLLEEGGDLVTLEEQEALGAAPESDGVKMRANAGRGDHARDLKKTLDNLHNSNILSFRFAHPDIPVVATGAVDKTLKITNYETGDVVCQVKDVFNGAIVTMDIQKTNPNRLVLGSMDGAHAVLDLSCYGKSGDDTEPKFKVVSHFKDHKKHVVRTKWAPNDTLFATASYDCSVGIYSDLGEDGQFQKVKDFSFPSAVEAVTFTNDSQYLIVAVREDNYLHYFHTETFKEQLVNMNSNKDEHVSFTAMELNLSPDGKYLLVSTDKNRIIMFSTGTPLQARNFWGAPNDKWSNPRAAWNLTQSYIYTTSEDKQIYTYDVGTEKVVSTLAGHTNVVRDLHRHPRSEIIGTCSYDKTVKLWEMPAM